MIRLLSLCLLLIFCVPAWAAKGNPASAGLSITVVPALTPPPQAVAAGFTTLALNSDFTTMSLSDIGCAIDGSSRGSSGWAYSGFPLPTNPYAGCGSGGGVYFATDQGSQALFVHWQPSFQQSGDACIGPVDCNVGISTANGPNFPLNMYVEITVREQVSAGNGGYWAFWSFKNPSSGNSYERDFIEANPGPTGEMDYDIINWYNGTYGPATFNHYNSDATQYHTYGVLYQGSTNQTQMSVSGYIDGVPIQGNNSNPFTVNIGSYGASQTKNALVIDQIPQSYPTNYIQDVIVKSVHVWTCASWQTTNCFPGQ